MYPSAERSQALSNLWAYSLVMAGKGAGKYKYPEWDIEWDINVEVPRFMTMEKDVQLMKIGYTH